LHRTLLLRDQRLNGAAGSAPVKLSASISLEEREWSKIAWLCDDIARGTSDRVKKNFTKFCIVAALVVNGAGLANASCGTLHAMAQQHASDMARRESLDHAGFMRDRGPRGASAENVAVGCANEACARKVWMNSPPHRANMILGGCQAVASAVSKSGRRYWAMEIGGAGNFASPHPIRRSGHRPVMAGRDAEFDGFPASAWR
jgi:hypothetical protein